MGRISVQRDAITPSPDGQAAHSCDGLVEAAAALIEAYPVFERKEYLVDGKRLIAFWSPAGALVDTSLIATLKAALAKAQKGTP